MTGPGLEQDGTRMGAARGWAQSSGAWVDRGPRDPSTVTP
jgi:hypothetical protein